MKWPKVTCRYDCDIFSLEITTEPATVM